MSCPTCDHTLARLCEAAGRSYFHCERCGTVVTIPQPDGRIDVYVPKLVDRCRTFEQAHLASVQAGVWRGLGIAESINPPDERLPDLRTRAATG